MNLHTTTDVARELGIHPSRVRRLAQARNLGVLLNNRLRVYSAEEVEILRKASTGQRGVKARKD